MAKATTTTVRKFDWMNLLGLSMAIAVGVIVAGIVQKNVIDKLPMGL